MYINILTNQTIIHYFQSRIYGNPTTFFNLFYFSINFGTLISMIVITWLQQDFYFFVGYLVSISALGMSFFIFISGKCCFKSIFQGSPQPTGESTCVPNILCSLSNILKASLLNSQALPS